MEHFKELTLGINYKYDNNIYNKIIDIVIKCDVRIVNDQAYNANT